MKILIQGAMPEEIDVLLEKFKPTKNKTIAGYDFYFSKFKGDEIIISLTKVGTINSAISTTVAIENFKPDLVINQGCAGAHKVELKKGDIVLGENVVYINSFKPQSKAKGEGSDSLSWAPSRSHSFVMQSTKKYLDLAKDINYSKNIYVGTLGSGDTFSKEQDRIFYLNSLFGEWCEDMESAASLKVCDSFKTEKLALRIISNNELTLDPLDKSYCKVMQEFIVNLIEKINKLEKDNSKKEKL